MCNIYFLVIVALFSFSMWFIWRHIWEWSLTISYEIYEFSSYSNFNSFFFSSLKIYRIRFVNRNRLWLLLSKRCCKKERKRVKKKIDLAAVALEILAERKQFLPFFSLSTCALNVYTQTYYGNSKLRMYSATKSRIILWKLAKAFCHKIFIRRNCGCGD